MTMTEMWDDESYSLDQRARVVARRRPSGSPALERPPYDSAPEWAARWGESAPPVGTVLRWTDTDGSNVRIAACVRDDTWNVTGAPTMLPFREVAKEIGNSPCGVAVDWREIPTVEARPAGDAAVKDWAAQFLAAQPSAKPSPGNAEMGGMSNTDA